MFPAQNVFVLRTVRSVLWTKVAGNTFAAVVKITVLSFKIKLVKHVAVSSCLLKCVTANL